MSEPIIAAKEPAEVALKKDENYCWCSCGRSSDQPFCDGSHEGTDLEPVCFTAEKSETAYLCQCKQTKTPPYCDGSHESL